MKTLNVIVKGKVQGVFFREYTRRRALALNLTGWVRNLQDGSVECTISGNDDDVDQMTTWFYEGSPLSMVREVMVRELPPDDSYTSFEIVF
jgi:acylphosphatase